MKNYLDEIEKKLKDNIKIESLEIVDNSFKHRKHKFFDSKKYHLKLN
ncbi:MAG: BolA family transcriptional regulator, partial [Rhodospirillaceae bacterium]|nr:BolA family transcriptional regulator [Rhodospirillaceae bacterium]